MGNQNSLKHKAIMESLLYLANRPPAPMLLRLPGFSSSSAPWRNELRFGLSRAYSPLIRGFGGHRPGYFFRPVIRAVDRSSKPSRSNDECERKTERSAIGAILVLACAIGIVSGSFMMKHKAIAGPREMHQKAPQAALFPMGGRPALKSLLAVPISLSSTKVKPTVSSFVLPKSPSMEEINDIKIHAVRLIKSGNPEEAIQFLQSACARYNDDPEPAYNVEMALVEILICQGKYKEALRCNCLTEAQRVPSDGRFPLYKAIIYTMLNDTEEARKWWEEYTAAVEEGFESDAGNFGI